MMEKQSSRRQLIFIDDSGDPGFKVASSSNFVMAAAVFIDSVKALALSEYISNYRRTLGWRDDYEFKFSKIRKDIIIDFLKSISKYDFRVYAVCIDKKAFRQTAPFIDIEKLYEWTIKELLLIIPVENVKIEIDGRSSKQKMRKTITYLRREMNADKNGNIEIRFEDSSKDNLIQLADIIAGAINRSMSSDKTDSRTYIKLFKKKIVQIKRITFR